MPVSKALCILDGRQTSTTCAVLACQQFEEVHAIIYEDGRQSPMALESAMAVADFLPLASYEIIDLGTIFQKPALSMPKDPLDLGFASRNLGNTTEVVFSATRQVTLLTLATERAALKGIQNIFVGLSETDFPDHWQHHQTYISLLAKVLGEALWRDPEALTIHTPLLNLTRADIVKLGLSALGNRFHAMFELTHDCEQGIEGGCGQCYSCLARDRGFQEADVEDPIWKFRATESYKIIEQAYQILHGISLN
ncbi:MAG: 7-cyano-7-deazaguanine synthase [Leptodesmis sp.]|uniref:7-cyano-7-deazaguanine synthase n=1 Tax=Leptodesmis TaxID=2664261 RepID=UPI001F1709FE|nr:7-cyano-7-deazaguanine synthase [Leptodesmis sichuanensis]UIE38076.1 7-cyano-7-deazaguanine synthase [Leptodesmis sichuanensis A121]